MKTKKNKTLEDMANELEASLSRRTALRKAVVDSLFHPHWCARIGITEAKDKFDYQTRQDWTQR